MSRVDFADLVQQPISFSTEDAGDRIVLKLIDTSWVQRLRDISQTANTRLVYMFSEHSRFGHSLGVAYLASSLLKKLSSQMPEQVESYKMAVCAAALLHDIGHLAPGSHTAVKTWYPKKEDKHEILGIRIIREVPEITEILEDSQPGLTDLVCDILMESPKVPAWTWQIISGGSWNVDRGNWCVVDSILAGVSYGRYNVGALLDSFLITTDNQLALRENRLDAMVHFSLSRHAMYRQVYQHRVIMAADTINQAIASRARDLGKKLNFADSAMTEVLESEDAGSLSLSTIFDMREGWWRYHLIRWAKSEDKILRDLASRALNRVLFKTLRIRGDLEVAKGRAAETLDKFGFDSRYYLHTVATTDMLLKDYQQPLLVQMDDGRLVPVQEADYLLSALVKESQQSAKIWLVMPAQVKADLLSL